VFADGDFQWAGSSSWIWAGSLTADTA